MRLAPSVLALLAGGSLFAAPIPLHDGEAGHAPGHAPAHPPAHAAPHAPGHGPAPAKRVALKAPVPVAKRGPVPPAAKPVAAKPAPGQKLPKEAAPPKKPAKPVAPKAAPAQLVKASVKAAVKPVAVFDRKAVQARYDAMSALVMRRDGAGLAKYFLGMTSKGFVFVDKKGRRFGRAKLVAQLKAQMRAVKRFVRSGNKVTSFALGKNGATVGVVSDFAMVFPPGKDGKPTTISGQSVTQDTWRKEAGGWKLASIRTLREAVKTNGKPM